MFRTLSALAAAFAVVLATPSFVTARDTRPTHGASPALNPDAIWAELMAGNQRFRDGKPVAHAMTRARLAELAKGQHPKAIVLTCSDSRVPPELLFDQGVGDIFVIRLAGNVAAKAAIGSVEYAAEHLGSPLLVVLGHSKCGAVSAAAASASIDAMSNIGCILADIAPAVATARRSGAKDEVDVAVHENARIVAAALLEHSEVLRHLVHEKKLVVVTAVYDLASGAVQVVPRSYVKG
jgi:carbonic anhydrase